LLLEGADLSELMVHVRAEFGPTARIVRAERVRTGGLAGFFARERYELTIDVPDTPVAPAQSLLRRRGIGVVPVGAAGGAAGIDALLAAADAADAAPDGSLPGFDVLAPAGTATVPDARPRVSTGEESFASVLEQMRAMTGAVAPDHQIEVPPPAPSPEDTHPVVTADRTFEPIVPPVVPAPVPAPAAERVGPGGSVAPTAPAPPAGPGVPRDALADLGVPAELLAACGDGPVELARLLAAVPPAPPLPRDPGTVLVVAGPPEDAARVADLLALRAGSGAVVHAGDAEAGSVAGHRLTSPVAAERWRANLAGGDGVTVVALGVRPGRTREDAAAELLAALAPDQAWGVVDARSKSRDCTRWIAAVGGRRPLDALAVGGLFETSEPGTVLGLGVPVAWIDGVPASRVAWAAALGEHLPDGTVWG
jgi:CBS domain-containing protein